MKTFITYFDFLGYKQFILNNDFSYVESRVLNILRDIEASLGQGKYKEAQYGVIADLSESKLNCLNISDTIILWTKDDSFESFQELLNVTFDFNWRVTCYHFPVRGAMVYDEIGLFSYKANSKKNGTYNVNSIFGKGLVNAHLKAENLNMAGCVIDKTVLDKIIDYGDLNDILGNYALPYKVPYKENLPDFEEYTLTFYLNKPIKEKGLNALAIESRKSGIECAFKNDNKGFNSRAKELFDNTIAFLEKMKDNE